jgi:hypothetical protein
MANEPEPSFWTTIVAKNRQRLQVWLSEQFEFLLQISSLVIAFGAFNGLRILGVDGWLVNWLEKLDNCMIFSVFILFLIRIARAALTVTLKSRGHNVHR